MKQSKNNFIFFFLMLLAVFSATAANAQNANQSKAENQDKIRIVSVTAASPVVDGVENEFTIEIEYTLETMDEGSVAIGFNVNDSAAFRMSARKRVKKGTNLMTLKAKVTPKDWKENGDFTVLVNLSPYPLPSKRYSPMASTSTVIDFAQ
ncbi:MAG: hypothetical protein M3525_10770 [Acidobacteriota bacterium]|nr:hypothetical protein [Acidobacteriota bacterium]